MQRPGRVRTVRTAERTCAAVCARCSRTNQAPPARRTWSNSETAVDEGGNVRCHELPRLVSRRSHDEFTAKIGLVAEEADESAAWLDFVAEARLVEADRLRSLQKEGHELQAIFSASLGTARRNQRLRINERRRRSRRRRPPQ